jgi:hypothetical protein
MSLMRLLAATRSIVNVKDHKSPYEMRPKNLLPKFGPLDRPGGKATAGSDAAPVVSDDEGEKDEDEPGEPPATSEANMKIEAPTLTLPAPEAADAAPANFQSAYPHGRWTFWKTSKPAHTPAPAEANSIQGELPLDLVRVVRNDLNDSDLEMAPQRRRPAPPEEPAAKTPVSTGLLWGRISERFFGASGAVR